LRHKKFISKDDILRLSYKAFVFRALLRQYVLDGGDAEGAHQDAGTAYAERGCEKLTPLFFRLASL
jgi:hypothetical protein